MANLMRLTKQELIAKLTTSENLVKHQDEQIQDVNNRVNELTSLLNVKNKGIEEQAEIIAKLNNELSKTNKTLDSHKDSLFKVTNELDDYKCKLIIANRKKYDEKSLHKYYFAGGVFVGIVLYFFINSFI